LIAEVVLLTILKDYWLGVQYEEMKPTSPPQYTSDVGHAQDQKPVAVQPCPEAALAHPARLVDVIALGRRFNSSSTGLKNGRWHK
jgi:hypothetical protein